MFALAAGKSVAICDRRTDTDSCRKNKRGFRGREEA
jgi:hypothetical protein